MRQIENGYYHYATEAITGPRQVRVLMMAASKRPFSDADFFIEVIRCEMPACFHGRLQWGRKESHMSVRYLDAQLHDL
jgi:hypothetical protein